MIAWLSHLHQMIVIQLNHGQKKNKQPPGRRLTHLLGPPLIYCWQKGYGRWAGHGALDYVSVTWAMSHLFEISMEVKCRWPDRGSDRNPSFFSMCVSAKLLQSCQTLWAHQAPLSMGFSRQGYWSGFLCPPPGDLPDSGIEPMSPVVPALQADSLPLSH